MRFKLEEFLILIILGGVAALVVVPLYPRSRTLHTERGASACLKTLTTAEADFRSNDRDGNGVNDYWTGDVFALYGLIPVSPGSTTLPTDTSSTNIIKLIQPSMAAADGASQLQLYGHVSIAGSIVSGSAEAGYLFRRFDFEDSGQGPTPLLNDTDGAAFYGAVHDPQRFAFAAFPESVSAEKWLFVVNEDNTIWKISLWRSYSATFLPLSPAGDSFSSVGGTGLGWLETWTYPAEPEASGATKMQ